MPAVSTSLRRLPALIVVGLALTACSGEPVAPVPSTVTATSTTTATTTKTQAPKTVTETATVTETLTVPADTPRTTLDPRYLTPTTAPDGDELYIVPDTDEELEVWCSDLTIPAKVKEDLCFGGESPTE